MAAVAWKAIENLDDLSQEDDDNEEEFGKDEIVKDLVLLTVAIWELAKERGHATGKEE